MGKHEEKIDSISVNTLKSKLEGEIVELKEDQSLMQQILVISQKCPELDLPGMLGRYEFSNAPRSLFSFDRKLHPCTDKSKLVHLIEKAATTGDSDQAFEMGHTEGSSHKIVIFDGMALVNKLNISKDIKTCKGLKQAFEKVMDFLM